MYKEEGLERRMVEEEKNRHGRKKERGRRRG